MTAILKQHCSSSQNKKLILHKQIYQRPSDSSCQQAHNLEQQLLLVPWTFMSHRMQGTSLETSCQLAKCYRPSDSVGQCKCGLTLWKWLHNTEKALLPQALLLTEASLCKQQGFAASHAKCCCALYAGESTQCADSTGYYTRSLSSVHTKYGLRFSALACSQVGPLLSATFCCEVSAQLTNPPQAQHPLAEAESLHTARHKG